MKILHISAYAHRGGCEKNCYHFIKGSPTAEHELLVLGEEGPMSTDWSFLQISMKHLQIVDDSLFSFGKQLKIVLAKKQFDLVICWSTIRLPLQLNALNGVTKNVKVYLGNPLAHNAIKDALLQVFYPYKGSVTLMACSNYVAKTYASAPYFKQFTVLTSLNPIALPTAYPEKKLQTNVYKIGMVARLDPIKDHATVLSAFQIVHQELPNTTLHLVGDGILRQKLEETVARLQLTNAVVFHGDVSNVYDYLNEWDVFVYATTPNEGLGSVVAEAMANGLPCVLSDLPMLRELAPQKELALFFEAGNAVALAEQLLHLLPNEELRTSMGIAAYHHAQQNFGIERFVKDYL